MVKYKLICFDVDGTLVDNLTYSWNHFHEFFGVDMKRRQKAKKDYYDGSISYAEWAAHDINLWKEMKKRRQDFLEAIGRLKLMKGALETISTLKKHGMKLAIISGSLNVIIETLLGDAVNDFDYVYLSHLLFDTNGALEGIKATAYDMEHKATALREIADKEKIKLSQTVFIGDHHNDLKAMEIAGLSIAFNPKLEEMEKIANVVITSKDLRDCLSWIL